MVDPDILRHKTQRVLHHVDRLRKRAAGDAAALAADEDVWNAVLMDLQQAIQACIDLAVHVCADEQLGPPATPAQAFALLARVGRVDADLSLRLAGAAGLRNLIVHQYGELDAERIVDTLRRDLDDLLAFVAALQPPAR